MIRRVVHAEIGLEVQVSGTGPDVLLVHGYPDTHDCWRHQVAALNAAGYRTIAPDLRGFGVSDKPKDLESYALAHYTGDLLAVLDDLGVERAHLVGHDWGSVLVQLLAVSAPHRAASLSCLSVGHAGSLATADLEQREKSWYMLLFQFAGVAESWLSRDDFAGARALLASHPDLGSVIERLRDPRALSSSLALYRVGTRPELLFGVPADPPPLPGPVMGVWSSDDAYLTERAMTGTEKHVAGPWRYERLDGVGHWMQLEAPEKVNELLLDFLATVGGESAA